MNNYTMNKHTIKFDKLIGYKINRELTDILIDLFEKDKDETEYNNIKILNEKTFEKEFLLKYKMKPSFSSCLIVARCGSFDYYDNDKNNYIISIHNSTLSSIYCNINKIYLPIYQYCNEYKKLVFNN
jgi:hypothetical protein